MEVVGEAIWMPGWNFGDLKIGPARPIAIHSFDPFSDIGLQAALTSWPFPTWAVRARPFDQARDA